jgi:hypothetical protein
MTANWGLHPTKSLDYVTVPADLRAFAWRSPDGSSHGSFRPNGKHYLYAGDAEYEPNAHAWKTKRPADAARLFVGFNVGDTARWTLDDLVAIVSRIRTEKHKARPDASFVAQRGVYTHKRSGKVIEEPGAQVIVIDVDGVGSAKFEKQMEDLAATIAKELQQEEVILELQRGGLHVSTAGVVAPRRRKR